MQWWGQLLLPEGMEALAQAGDESKYLGAKGLSDGWEARPVACTKPLGTPCIGECGYGCCVSGKCLYWELHLQVQPEAEGDFQGGTRVAGGPWEAPPVTNESNSTAGQHMRLACVPDDLNSDHSIVLRT